MISTNKTFTQNVLVCVGTPPHQSLSQNKFAGEYNTVFMHEAILMHVMCVVCVQAMEALKERDSYRVAATDLWTLRRIQGFFSQDAKVPAVRAYPPCASGL
jgi:hypothetical protein